MTTLDMTGRLGSSLRGTELVERYRGDTNAEGLRHGKGTYAFPNDFFAYEGDFVDGAKHGTGKLSMADGGWYEGEFVKDEMTGLGRRVWSDGRSYEGQFVLGEMMGRGKYTMANGDWYEGIMVSNSREVRGVLTCANGDVYDGEFKRNVPNGKGKHSLAASGENYDGNPAAKDFVGGARHGHGTMSTPAGDSYEGAWVNGLRHGAGRGVEAESGVSYVGEYAFDVPVAVPCRMEVAPASSSPTGGGGGGGGEEEEEGEGSLVGTPDAPVTVAAGEELPAGVVRLRVRLPWVPPPPPPPAAPGEGEAAAAAEAEDNDASTKVGEIATHESGRALRCSLHVGLAARPEVEVEEAAAAAGEPAPPPLVYGEEVLLAEGSTEVVFTAAGVAAVEGVVIAAATAPGVYTLRVVDATPGPHGDLGRCPEVRVVLDVRPPRPPPEGEGEGEENGDGGKKDSA